MLIQDPIRTLQVAMPLNLVRNNVFYHFKLQDDHEENLIKAIVVTSGTNRKADEVDHVHKGALDQSHTLPIILGFMQDRMVDAKHPKRIHLPKLPTIVMVAFGDRVHVQIVSIQIFREDFEPNVQVHNLVINFEHATMRKPVKTLSNLLVFADKMVMDKHERANSEMED